MPPTVTERLFAAAESGDSPTLCALLDDDLGLVHVRRPAPDALGGSARPTLLQVAACAGHLDMVQALIQRGAEIYETAQWGYPAVAHAAWEKQEAVVAWFLGDGARHETMSGDPTYGLGIDINLAARFGWTDIVAQHLARDPLAVHRRGVIGETPLHWSAHNGHAEVVEALLAAGADVEADEVGLYGGKPLHWAAEHAPDTVRLLLAAGANPNSRNTMPGEMGGFTPLIMCAAQRNDCAECAELLLAAGADAALRADDGRTALDVAEADGHSRVAAAIRRAGA